MARMLSGIARHGRYWLVVTLATCAAATSTYGEGEVRVSPAPPTTVVNPFAKGYSARPVAVADEPEPGERGPTTYQNPFARMSAAPPLEIPMRRGPISRWRRPVLPIKSGSPIRSAILSAEPVAGARVPWNELPPAEELRERLGPRQPETDEPGASHFGEPPDPIRFVPQPIRQPNWLAPRRAVGAEPVVATEQIQFRQAEVNDPFDEQSAGVPDEATKAVDGPMVDGPLIGSPNGHAVTADSTCEETAASSTDEEPEPLVISDFGESPKDWLAQSQNLAQTAESIEDLSAIVNLCERGMASSPPAELVGPLRRMAAWAHNRRGEMLTDSDRHQEAIRDFRAAIDYDPNCSLAIHNRAVTLAQHNETAAALREFNRVIELNPGLAIAYRNRAELLASLGRIEEALADYTRAIQGLPDNAELYRVRGSAWHRAGDYERALADLNRAIELAPDADAYTQRGNVAAERGGYDQALRDFHEALAIDAKWAEAYRSLAWLYATCGDASYRDPEQALAAAQRAAELAEPGDCFVLDALAAAYASGGAFEEAVVAQERALAAAPPDFADPLRQRLALYQQGQPFVSRATESVVRAASAEEQQNGRQQTSRPEAPLLFCRTEPRSGLRLLLLCSATALPLCCSSALPRASCDFADSFDFAGNSN